jgi:hypothetical protein
MIQLKTSRQNVLPQAFGLVVFQQKIVSTGFILIVLVLGIIKQIFNFGIGNYKADLQKTWEKVKWSCPKHQKNKHFSLYFYTNNNFFT